jgi:hypothetical protein
MSEAILQYAFMACTETTLFHIFSLRFLTSGEEVNSEWKHIDVKSVSFFFNLY